MINNVYVNNDGKVEVRKGYIEDIFPKGVYKSPNDKLVDHSEEVDNSDKEMDCLVCHLGKERACIDCYRDWDSEEED